VRLFEVLPLIEETARRYATITRVLREQGQLIGTNDLWIAASALEHGETLVTRNLNEFRRIPGLSVTDF
jgi:tRNA(fMet)-specific endonuclease VapC